ncbi:MAG: DHH family phosphoesterase [Nitrososphaerota archaeon]|nr:DHH family phosphoesterase [Candidatus Geocrenenecus dongiae]
MEIYSKILREVAEEIKNWSGTVGIVFHDDADGLCAAGIAVTALKKTGLNYKLICIEKIHPAILKLIHSTNLERYLYLDIGSGKADLIKNIAEESGSRVVIVDHHDPVKVESKNVVNLNPELYGFRGERDVSGSTATYLLMKNIEDVRESAWMAVVGSAEIPGELESLNKIPLEDAVKIGDVEVRRGRETSYYISFLDKPWSKISTTLTIIGSVGYYRGGPNKAVENLTQRKIDFVEAEKLEEERKSKFNQALNYISRTRLKIEGFVQWFHLENMFKGFGSKTIGTFCSTLSYKSIIDQEKYLVGFMNFEKSIPGLGEIQDELVKVSVRTPRKLSEYIEAGRMPPASKLTMKSAETVGGTGDGHSFAASAIIPSGKERDFIKIFNNIVENRQTPLL